MTPLPPARPRPHPWKDTAALAAVLLSTIAALWPVCRAGFVNWDDPYILYHNPTLNPPHWVNLLRWWARPYQGLYTPVAYTVWGALTCLARTRPDPQTGIDLNPHVFHAANLVIHLLTVTVAWLLLRRLTGRGWPAAAGALLFAVHPVQVESVAHASGIQGLLCGLFSLTAVLLYLRSAADQGPTAAAARAAEPEPEPATPPDGPVLPYEPAPVPDPFRPRLYAVATAAFALALLSKPAAMTVPLLAGVLQVAWLGRPPASAVRRLWPWLLLSFACGAAVRAIQTAPRFDVAIPFHDRPLIAGYTLAFYLYKIVMPWRMGIVYPRATPAALLRGDVVYYAWLAPAALSALLAQAWRTRRDLRPGVAGTLWFAAGLLPVLGLTRFDFQTFSTVADRYLYLPMFGVALCAAWLLSRPGCLARPRRVGVVCVLVLAALGVRSHLQTFVWHDSDALFRNAHAVAGDRVGTEDRRVTR